MAWHLPPKREIDWVKKPLASARTQFNTLPYGSFELLIEHDIIRGVTPDMLNWWFHNIGGSMTVNGTEYPRYLVWHPIDHIHWELAKAAPGGGAGVGASFRIVEAFGGDMHHLIDSVEEVIKLDSEGITLIRRIAGLEVFRLAHRFVAVEGGTLYGSRMQVGAENPIGKWLLNPLLHRLVFTREMGPAWLRHNVEEVGNFESFLPDLYAAQRFAFP